MIGPAVNEPHPRSLLKRKATPPLPDVVDIVSDVCNYETISDYIQLFGPEEVEEQGGSPASLESGYNTGGTPDDEDSNLSWLLNFKVSSLFDPTEDQSTPAKRDEGCMCAGTGTTGYQQSVPGKPPFTYTELIEKALKEQGQLTVSGIYTWISVKLRFPSSATGLFALRAPCSVTDETTGSLLNRAAWSLLRDWEHCLESSQSRTAQQG
ncbi:hypothetical protein J6590_080904 [Homalodisca vitripennis]|nr:hypothetical protein J6590_080904 [Homalodisca vitripennis]